MKRLTYITAFAIAALIITVSSCDSKRQPGKVYMPDMAYSRAYESYALRDSAIFSMDRFAAYGSHKIFYNSAPVPGTIKRGELFPVTVAPNNTLGLVDSNALIVLSDQIKNPLGPLSTADSVEAGRLFNINCAVCHGPKAEANGPVGIKLGGVKSIMTAVAGGPGVPGFSDGRLFYVITYGQNNMGSYASQLDRKQRWMIVQYIRSLQPKTAAPATPAAATGAKTDTAVVAKK